MPRAALLAAAIAALLAAGCTRREDVTVRTPLAAPRPDPDARPAPPAGRSPLRATWALDGDLVTGAIAWAPDCEQPLVVDVEVATRSGVGPAVGPSVAWLVAGTAAVAGGATLVVVGARGDEAADARATPPGLLLGALGAYAVGASIDALLAPSRAAAARRAATERLPAPAPVPCGAPEGLARIALALALPDGRLVPGTRGGGATTAFVVPPGASGPAEILALEDPSGRLAPRAVVGAIDLPARPPAAPTRFAPDSPSIAGGVASVEIARGAGRPEVCGNLEDDDGDGVVDPGCGFRVGSLGLTLAWSAPEDLDLLVTGPDGVEVSAARTTGGDAGLAMDRDAAGAFGPRAPGPYLENVYAPAAIAPRPGRYRAEVVVARSRRTGAEVVDARLVGRAAGRAFVARLRLPARVGERAEIAFEIEPGAPLARPVGPRPLVAGHDAACALGDRGGLVCRGDPPAGLVEPLGDPLVDLSLGDGFGCAARASGRVLCWGDALYGRTGVHGIGRPASATVRDLDTVQRVAAGRFHACALRAAGDVACWGRADHGELGPAAARRASSAAPVAIPGLSAATAIAAGDGFACALVDARVRCWGDGALGQLGDGAQRASATPVAVAGLDDAVAVTAGRAHACALRRGGEALCWGWNFEGEVGDGTTKLAPRPVVVRGLGRATALSAGATGTCALLEDGAVACWGEDLADATGADPRGRRLAPARVRLPAPAREVAVGKGFACATLATGAAHCWGVAPVR